MKRNGLGLGIVLAALKIGTLLFNTNSALAEDAKPVPNIDSGKKTVMPMDYKNHFPFPDRLDTKIEAEFQPVSGSDYSHFGFSLTEMGEDGKPVYGDFARVFIDRLPDATTRTNAGVMLPFDFGYKGKLKLYGMEHGDDGGIGTRIAGGYGDWLLKGVFERLESEGKNKELKGLGMGRIFHSDWGKTTIELWGYDKTGKKIANLYLFQNFPDGHQGGLSFTGGDDSERDFSMSFGRFRDRKSWRLHGGTAMDGEGFSFGGSFILDPDPRFANTPFGYLNTEDGAKSYQTLWEHAMGYYPYQKLFERGAITFHAGYFHNNGLERVSAQASLRPFYSIDLDPELLRGIHIDGGYDRNGLVSGHDDRLTWGLGIQHKGLDFYVEKTEGEEPVFGFQCKKMF